jgi:hypothetical protein
MFDPALKPVGLYVEQGRELVPGQTLVGIDVRPANGSLSGLDVMITPAGSQISGVAYTNDETDLAFNGGVTTLYTLDSFSDQLMIQTGPNGNPNAGVAQNGLKITEPVRQLSQRRNINPTLMRNPSHRTKAGSFLLEGPFCSETVLLWG